jgi:signal transduction histidine kinase
VIDRVHSKIWFFAAVANHGRIFKIYIVLNSATPVKAPASPLSAMKLQKPLVKGLLVLGLWTLIGLAFASQLYLARSQIGDPVSWRFAAQRALADWYVFAALSWPSLWLARRFPIERMHWQRNLLLHLGASAVFSLLWMVLRAGVEQIRGDQGPVAVSFEAAFQHALVATFFFNLLIYWAIISVSHAFAYYQKFHERELRTAELEKRLTQAKLQALQMQLNPHFLFNTLHGISSLMHKDVEAADKMITRLSDLLRYALNTTETQEVALEDELTFLQRYLEIEKTRFGPRLSIQMDIAPNTLQAHLPNLILQPIVENAIRHGIEPHSRPGKIQLHAHRENSELIVRVSDNGSGLPPVEKRREGVGLSNTRARLDQLYGPGHHFTLSPAEGGGTQVQIRIPFRLDPQATSAVAEPPDSEPTPLRLGKLSAISSP